MTMTERFYCCCSRRLCVCVCVFLGVFILCVAHGLEIECTSLLYGYNLRCYDFSFSCIGGIMHERSCFFFFIFLHCSCGNVLSKEVKKLATVFAFLAPVEMTIFANV